MIGRAGHGVLGAGGRRARLVAFAGLGLGAAALSLALSASSAQAAGFAATASVSNTVQYLGDSTGTVFTFTVHNTGSAASIGAVEIDRPSRQWTITGCPLAPNGWTWYATDSSCRYRSLGRRGDDLRPGHSSSAFRVRATTARGSADRTGTWSLIVSRTNAFDRPGQLFDVTTARPGLTTHVYAFQVLGAGVASHLVAPGSACPTLSRTAPAGSTQNVVVCGRNHASTTLSPNGAHSQLHGTWLTSAGTFGSGPVAPSTSSRVLGTWTGAHLITAIADHKTVVAVVGSANNRTSPARTLTGYRTTNRPPDAVDDAATTDQNTTVSVSVLANDTDPDGNPITITAFDANATAGGTVTQSGNDLVFAPGSSFVSLGVGQQATTTFGYTITDSHGASDSATVTVTVTGLNDAPTATPDTAGTTENTAIAAIHVLANDSDPDTSDTLSVHSVDTTGTVGVVHDNGDGTISYDPNGQFNALGAGQQATDHFSYVAVDSHGALSAAATVTITIAGVDDPPVLAAIEPGALAYGTGSGPSAITSTLTAADSDDANLAGATVKISSGYASGHDSLGFSTQNGISGNFDPGTGVLTLTGTASVADYQSALRSVTFAADAGTPSGTRTVDFQVSDGGAESNVVSRNITVTHVNHAPIAADDVASTDEDTAITSIPVLANDSDPDGDSLTVASIDTTGTAGTVTDNGDGTIGYDPSGHFDYLAAGQQASDTFSYIVTDGSLPSNSATVTMTVTGVNDAPVLANIENDDPDMNSGPTGQRTITSSLTVADVDNTNLAGASVSISSGFSSASDDSLLFTDQNGITGTYTASTGRLELAGSSSVANYQAALRSVQFVTDSAAPTADRSFTFTVNDGTVDSNAVVRSLHVVHFNAPPVAGADAYTAQANTAFGVGVTPAAPSVHVVGTVLSNDSDLESPPAALTATLNAGSVTAGASVSVSPDGTFSYLPPAGFTGDDTFTYTLHDNDPDTPKTATGTVTITVAGPVIWYVDDSLGAAGDGRSTTPFNSLTPVNGAGGLGDADAPGAVIFVYQGSANYTGLQLEANEKLWGQTQGLTVNAHALVAPGSTNPVLAGTVTLANGSDVQGVDISSPAGNGITGTSVTTSTVGSTTPVTISGATADGVHLSGSAGGDITIDAAISGSAGNSVDVANRTSGTVSFGKSVADTGLGVSLVSNTGATVAFTGGLTVSSATHNAFSATGGGTVSVTGATNTLTTTTGTPLTVTGTTIGASGLTFKSVTSNGASDGIVLINTGAAGHLTVTGTGAAGSGGSIQASSGSDLATNNCGDLGTSVPAGVGVYLKNTSAPSLSYLAFPGTFGNFGILGYSVDGFTLDHTTMSGTYGDNVNQDEDAVHFCTLTGSATISNDTIANGAETNLRIVNASGTLNRLTMTNDTLGLNQTGGGDGTLLEADGGTLNATVLDSTFQGSGGSPFQATPQAGATMDLVFGQPGHGNTVHNTHSNIAPYTQDLNVAAGGALTFDINSNHFDSAAALQAQGGVFINAANSTASASGYFRNNTIGTSGVANSGSSGNDPALDVESNGGGDLTIKIDNNQMYQWGSNGAGFLAQAGGTGGNPTTFNVTATNNTIAQPGTFAVANSAQGFQLDNGTNSGENFTSCVDFASNVLNGSGTGVGGDARFRQRFDTHVDLPGYTGTAGDIAAIQSYVIGLNPTGPPTVTAVASTAAGGGFFNTPGSAACAVPSF